MGNGAAERDCAQTAAALYSSSAPPDTRAKKAHSYRETVLASARPMLRGLSDIFSFFGNNETPIYFVSPTPFNVLGIDKWVNNFWFVNYFDSFDGHHPHVFVPTSSGPQEFKSMEEISNYLLGHKEVVDFTCGKGGKVVLVMFDKETEELAKDLGLDIALPPARLRKHLDSKIVTTRIGNEA